MVSRDKLREILNDETFKNVVNEVIQTHIQAIIHSTDKDTYLREVAYTRIKVTQELLAHMQSIVDSTKIEDAKWKL